MGYVSHAQRKAVHASKAEKKSPAKAKNLEEVAEQLEGAVVAHGKQAKAVKKHIKEMKNSPVKGKISAPCKAAAKRKFKVWPSAYASGWGVRCTTAGGPSKMGKGSRKKK
jgi:hypothetical protein